MRGCWMVAIGTAGIWVTLAGATVGSVPTKHRHVAGAKRQHEISLKLSAKARELEERDEAADTAAAARSKQNRQQAITWHLSQAQQAWHRNDMATAYAQWGEVLRLDPSNAVAATDLHQAVLNDAKHALERFAEARGISAIAEALDDESDDRVAQQLVGLFEPAIEDVDSNVETAPDPALYDDFQNYLRGNHLEQLVADVGNGTIDGYSPGRIYGRKFLLSLAPWMVRLNDCGIDVTVLYPYNSEHAADDIQSIRFTIMPSGDVVIDGTNVGPDVPLAAVWQDGAYRIAPRSGFHLMYQFQSHIHTRRWKRT